MKGLSQSRGRLLPSVRQEDPQHPEEMDVSRAEEEFVAVNYAEKTLHKIENYLKEKQLCDVILIAGNMRIPAPRLVLSAMPDYFAVMFTSDMREARQEEEHFIEVIKNQEFLLLPANGISKLLCSDDINVTDEETIFNAVMQWVGYDVQVLMTAPCLLLILSQKLLIGAMKYQLSPERRQMLKSPQTKPRKSNVGALYVVGGTDAMKGTHTIENYDLSTNSWQHSSTMSSVRFQFGVAVIDRKLYVLGGSDGLKTLNTMECFDPTGKAWTVMPPMSPPRHGLEALEGREPSYHEPDSGPDEEMEEEQRPLVEEALVQLCDKEIQTIEIASIGSSKKVYPSLLTATWTVATDPSGIPFEEWWNEIQGTLKRLTLALVSQQKMGQPHPERRDSPVSKAETAPLERAGFDPVQPISSEQTKEKTVEQKTEKGLEQKEKQPVESKEEKPRVLPVNMQKRQRKVTPLEAVLQQAQDQGEDTQEFFVYPVLERPGVATPEGPVYAVGGHDGSSYLNTVERWGPEGCQQIYMASMSTPRSTVGIASLNSKLYAIGGSAGRYCLKSMEYSDPHTNK
ncbi:Kelch-Like Protein 4 [Manis pentadactyla]|nr:Kelch-Like Protein 4 [Manis pentadactyla]